LRRIFYGGERRERYKFLGKRTATRKAANEQIDLTRKLRIGEGREKSLISLKKRKKNITNVAHSHQISSNRRKLGDQETAGIHGGGANRPGYFVAAR